MTDQCRQLLHEMATLVKSSAAIINAIRVPTETVHYSNIPTISGSVIGITGIEVGNTALFGGFAHDLKESGIRLQHTADHFQTAVTDLNQLHDTLQKAADALANAGEKLKETGQLREQVGGG